MCDCNRSVLTVYRPLGQLHSGDQSHRALRRISCDLGGIYVSLFYIVPSLKVSIDMLYNSTRYSVIQTSDYFFIIKTESSLFLQ